MKLHLPLSLRSSLLACIAALASAQAFTATDNLGDTMFVGDSITHGVNTKSWRWEFHKLLVDNEISYTEVGIVNGNVSGNNDNTTVNLDQKYGTSVWVNRHAARTSERAYEVAGRINTSGRLQNTNILQWLNPESNGAYHLDAGITPQTYFMMIGTNDLLSENNSTGRLGVKTATGEWQNLPNKVKFLLGTKDANGQWDNTGDMYTIIDAMRDKSGKGVDIVLLSVPTVYAAGRPNDFDANDLEALAEYNALLKEWANQKGVTLVQSDIGIVDVAAPDKYKGQGVESMFLGGNDRLHPTTQGDLIIAGNVAKQLGYAGRTAGQTRMKARDFHIRDFSSATTSGTVSGSSVTLGSGAALSYAWESTPAGGYTVDFTLRDGIGNGSTDGWDTTHNFSISIGDGSHSGTLNINEAYIQWGSTILYSIDTSKGLASLRVAYVYGNKARGLDSGFYVWLDDQLIGQGLTNEGTTNGLTITNGTGSEITLADLALDADGSWAPWSDGEWGNPLIEASGTDFPGRKEMAKLSVLQNPGGSGTGLTSGQDTRMVDMSGKGAGNATLLGNFRSWLWDNSAGEDGRVVGGTLTGNHIYSTGNKSYFGITSGNYTGDIYANVEGTIWHDGWMSFQRGAGTLKGNGFLRYGEDAEATNQGTIFGTANAGANGGINGNLYFEFSSPNFTVADGTFNGTSCSVAGVYISGVGISGEFRVVVNAGTFMGAIVGGAVHTNNAPNGGKVSFYLNGGVFNGNIYGGGAFGSVESSYIEITGNTATFNGTMISAGSYNGNASGAVTGDATIKLSQVTDAENGIGAFTGTISGGWKDVNGAGTRSLVFSGVQLTKLKATIENFDSISIGDESEVGLTRFGDATSVTVNGGSTLTALESLEVDSLDNMGTVEVSSGKTLTVNGVTMDDLQALAGVYVLDGSTLSMGAATNGRYEVQVTGSSSLSLANGAQGIYDVQMAKGSTLALSASGFAGQISLSLSGSGTVTNASGTSAAVSIDDSPAAGQGSFNLGGLNVTGLTLKQLSSGSQVSGVGGSDALTLTGESSIVLGSDLTSKNQSLLVTNRALSLGDDATLRVDVNSIVDEVMDARGEAVAYYLSRGDLSALANGGVVFDATLATLGWDVEYGADGALRFTAPDTDNIYDSSKDNQNGTEWGGRGKNIYESVGKYDAVLVGSNTNIDLSKEDVPQAYLEDGLTLKNLMGTDAKAELSITGKENEHTRVTITNTLGEEQKEKLETALGITIEDTLTFAGRITITDAELQIKHVDPDKGGKGKADSTTIVQGNLTLKGSEGLTMTSGVLRLEGKKNDLGGGDVRFAGNDGQIVVATGKTLAVGGTLEVGAGQLDTARSEHVLLESAGELTLGEGAAVGQGVTIGNEDATQVGVVAVKGSHVQVAQNSCLAHVELRVEGGLAIAPSKERTLSTQGSAAWELAGLSGGGAITSAEAKDMAFTVQTDHTYTGSLENYQGTMTFHAGNGTQYFVGVKGGSSWNVTNERGGHVVFNLAGNGGSNTLTMGKLTLERGSHTSILLDLGRAGAPTGLQLSELEATTDAHLTVGHYEGLATLEGKEGELVTLAVVTISGDDHDFDKVKQGMTLELLGIRNAREVDFLYSTSQKTLSLVTYVDNSLGYVAYARGKNPTAGARMLWALENSYLLSGDLAGLDATVYTLLKAPMNNETANVTEANRVMAAAAGSSLSVLGQALSDDVERQLHSIRNRTTTLTFPSTSEQTVDMWVNAESNYHRLQADGLMPGYKLNSWGGTVGAAISLDKEIGVGLALTAMYGDLSSEGADRLKGDMDTFYVTAFLCAAQDAWRYTLLATVGHARVDARRTVDYGAGAYSTGVSPDGTAFGLMYEIGYSIPLDENCSTLLQPVANITFRYSRVKGFGESGSSNARLQVGAQEQSSVTFGVGARMQGILGETAWNRTGLFELRALMKVRAGDSSGKATVAFSHDRALRQEVESASIGSLGAELGAGISVPISPGCDFFADAAVELWNHYTNANATIGIKISF